MPYDQSINFSVRQINQGFSKKAGTLRGLHFQDGEYAQAKLVSCLHGSIFNVAVDLRKGETFGHAYSVVLSFENRKQMYIPRGFAHGYLTLEDDTLMQLWLMARHADPANVPDSPEEFLDQFNTFSIYQILPQLIELWGLNVQTEVESRKNLEKVSGK